MSRIYRQTPRSVVNRTGIGALAVVMVDEEGRPSAAGDSPCEGVQSGSAARDSTPSAGDRPDHASS